MLPRRNELSSRALIAAALGLTLVVVLAGAAAHAAEIKVLSTVGMQPATPELFAQFEAATGHRIVVTYGLAAVLKTQFLDGAPADVLILTGPIVDDLAKQGKVVAGSKIDVARSGVGVGVKAGAPRPDISTPDALKNALLAAKSVGYSREGASGVAFARATERLGVADQIKTKYKDTGTKAGEMLVAGEIELGAAQIPELMAVPGVEVVGPLPAELQTVTIFSVGLATEAKEPGPGRALIEFLAGPRATPVYKAKGLGG
jgi:molybdate transport system substrate-binding protein